MIPDNLPQRVLDVFPNLPTTLPWLDTPLQQLFDQIDVIDYTEDDTDPNRRILTLQLAALSNREARLGGLEHISFVLNPGGFEVTATITPTLVTVSFTISILVRFSTTLLRPVRKVVTAGRTEYVPDSSRRYVEVAAGSISIEADSDGNTNAARTLSLNFADPVQLAPANLAIESGQMVLDLEGDERCLVFQWTENRLSEWLRQLSPTIADQGNSTPTTMTLRTILSDPQEIRLDWQMSSARSFSLPGVKVTTPTNPRFTLVLGGRERVNNQERDRSLTQLALILTMQGGTSLVARSTFAWERDGNRELQNEDTPPQDDKALFELQLAASAEVSLVLVDINLSPPLRLPRFFRQLKTPLAAIDLTKPETICSPGVMEMVSLDFGIWQSPNTHFRLGLDKFELPFLKEKGDNSGSKFDQFLRLDKPGDLKFPLDFVQKTIAFPIGATVQIGPLSFKTGFSLIFNWETFAVKVEHSGGIDLIADYPEWPRPAEGKNEHFGLRWRIKGSEITSGANKGKYHYFTLVTDRYNYQVQQAEGAVFELDYTKASDEPITFAISSFVLSPKGVSLVAEVTDRPARLNGLDTRFRFHGSRLEINENRIKDFTLSGSGPLPPALVGDAMADISLQFSQRDGRLTLVAGAAQLRGSKLLHCKATRFQFQIDAIGLKFVNEGKFHLYFTLTGSAQFVLAPGDDRQGALAMLPTIKIDLVECPLTGDASVIAKHVKFVIELPKPLRFNFLGAFEMELRAIGFIPQAKELNGRAAMEITGQLRFAQGPGDTPDPRPDYHILLIGLPRKGEIFPQIYFKRIAVNLNIGSAFKLAGVVEFIDEETEKGFYGKGMLELQGMPSFAAAFSFLRVRRDPNDAWVRAWFIYLEVRGVSFQIPVIEIYLREIGLGFGYRFTIASIKAVDQANDLGKLIGELRRLSRTAADLTERDRWAVDLEERGQSPRWTIVLRAMISQTSAQAGPLRFDKNVEKNFPCIFLIDAMIAFRSDLTFFMAVRGWVNTNYVAFFDNVDNLREKPMLSGFVLLSVRQKRFLMNVSSNPDAYIGDNPPLPDFVKDAIRSVEFSATLLIEPGLFHFELGWPNMLRWKRSFGPLNVEFRGGFIFRITTRELVIGISFEARGSLRIDAGVDLKLVGVRIKVSADVAFGARMIGLIPFDNPQKALVYAGIGLELRIQISIEFYIRIPLVFTTIKLSFRFSLGVGLTASLEVAINAMRVAGVRGQGTLSLSAMGHSLQFSAKFTADPGGVVQEALAATEKVMNLGLEATEVDALPGVGGGALPASAPSSRAAAATAAGAPAAASPTTFDAQALSVDAQAAEPAAPDAAFFRPLTAEEAGDYVPAFHLPGYIVFLIRPPRPEDRQPDEPAYGYFVVMPQGERLRADGTTEPETGFLPPPPLNLMITVHYLSDFLNNYQLFDPQLDDFRARFDPALQPQFTFLSVIIRGQRWLIDDRRGNNLIRYQVDRIPQGADQLRVTHILTETRAFTYNNPPPGADGYVRIPYPFSEIFPGFPFPVEFDMNQALINDALGQFFQQGFSSSNDINIVNRHILRRVLEANGLANPVISQVQITQPGAQVLLNVSADGVNRQYRVRRMGPPNTIRTYDFAEIANPNEVKFTIENGIETGQLNQGQLPDAIRSLFTESAQVSPAGTEHPGATWIIQDTVDGETAVYTVYTLPGDPLRLRVRLVVDADFRLRLPQADTPGFALWRYDPTSGDWQTASTDMTWRVNWDAEIFDEVTNYQVDGGGTADEQASNPQAGVMTLGSYLSSAFKLSKQTEHVEHVIPIGDPNPAFRQFDQPVIEDDRVYNPSDNNFEAAVRGALEQFEGSPYFKRDLNYTYDRLLDAAFAEHTTIYNSSGDGDVPEDPAVQRDTQENEQATQLRGMVIHDFVTDLQGYAAGSDEKPISRSIPFQMGLVFRFEGAAIPEWLDTIVVGSEDHARIQQRPDPKASAPAPEAALVNTFNIRATAFDFNPPQFQRVQQFTSANTIAITWELRWAQWPHEGCTPSQADPEHHLAHYRVQRRTLDGSEREIIYTVKNAQALHREQTQGENGAQTSVLQRLKPRFQLVDHFSKDTLDDLATLPETGRSYLYTVTPVDFAGNLGRPLTLIATRRPNQPPLVPVDAQLVVRYRLDDEVLLPDNVSAPAAPRIITPDRVHVEWNEPTFVRSGPRVPVKGYRLIFRKDATLPIGSYGLDSSTQGPRAKSLPTSNARPLPTDIKIDLDIPAGAEETTRRRVVVALAALQEAGILPAGDPPLWRPESWRVFIQAVSVNGVPSALAPVQLLLRVEMNPLAAPDVVDFDEDKLLDEREERQPAELEWLTHPIRFPLLPPEDQRALPGIAHFPMPDGDFLFSGMTTPDGNVSGVSYRQHPAGIRFVRFRWNQGPSDEPDYPLNLNAGYEILQLDIDAQTTRAFADADLLADALSIIQEVQMLPADDLLLAPGDTLTTNQWEAWYPSAMRRLRQPDQMAETGSEIRAGPWYSWRESYLEWPDPGALIDSVSGVREFRLHPALQAIVDLLADTDQPTGVIVDLQTSPPMQPTDFAGFMNTSPTNADPYGWGILQLFGLSMTVSLRDPSTGRLLTDKLMLARLKAAIDQVAESNAGFDALFRQHLYVELLFQPGQSIDLAENPTPQDALLGLVQISLRPVVRHEFRYARARVSGPAKAVVRFVITPQADAPASLINLADPASGQAELEPTTGAGGQVEPIEREITLPLTGETTLLLRAADLPALALALPLKVAPGAANAFDAYNDALAYQPTPAPHLLIDTAFNAVMTPERRESLAALLEAQGNNDTAGIIRALDYQPLGDFAPTDEYATYFTVNDALLSSRFASADSMGAQWKRFKLYIEALNGLDDPKITIPTSADNINEILPDFLVWSGRFFDACGDLVYDPATARAQASDGPWMATAYPRAGSPAFAAPDEAGRLKYDHLFEDKWAHNYRFFVRPYGRYDLLWQSLRQSPSLFAGRESRGMVMPPATPDPEMGGLDVVLERTHPVDAPVILESRRLDRESEPGQAVPPAPIWEVMVAQHREQALIERNQTLARQLSFRQVAFTLLRRFALPGWSAHLQALLGRHGHDYPISTRTVENEYTASIPAAYPALPDHIDLSASPMPEADLLSLSLPQRVGAFQQGVMALQWQALPFYYEHRLLIMAQTTTNVSPINSVTQREFEYRAPEPGWIAECLTADWQPGPPFAPEGHTVEPVPVRVRRIEIPLRPLWDSLPPEAQARWPSEAPDGEDPRKYAALPDPEAVYQVVEVFSGNVEVQVEYLYDADPSVQDYTTRQLGQSFVGGIVDVRPPQTPDGDFLLVTTLQQISELKLDGSYSASSVATPTRHKVAFIGPVMRFVGVLTNDDRDRLRAVMGQSAADQAAIDELYESWFSEVYVSDISDEDDLPGYPHQWETLEEVALVWEGTMSAAQAEAVLALPGDQAFRDALARLVEVAQQAGPDDITVEFAPPAPIIAFAQLAPDKLTLIRDEAASRYTGLQWLGLQYDDERDALAPLLDAWENLPDLKAALENLLEQLDTRSLALPLPPAPRLPSVEDLPGSLQDQLVIVPGRVEWQAPAPSDEQMTALEELIDVTSDDDNPVLLGALESLLEAINAPRQVPLDQPDQTDPLETDTLPEVIRTRLVIDTDNDTLSWNAPNPSDDQRAALEALAADNNLPLWFTQAVEALLSSIDTNRQVDEPALIPRITQDDLPLMLQDHITLEAESITWRGRPANANVFGLLQGLESDPPLNDARDQIIDWLQNEPVIAPLDLADRPTNADVPDPLLIAQARIRYHGLMSREEGQSLRERFTLDKDMRAVERLYATSIRQGLRGRELHIRTRRGSATPTDLNKPLVTRPLAQE
jgi:hypothetical protein